MVETKNGTEINAVLQSIELELVLSDESLETIRLTWNDLDAQFIKDLRAFVIRKYG
jgi:hypothetical protein